MTIAGDPKQLGPVLRSPTAIKYKLGTIVVCAIVVVVVVVVVVCAIVVVMLFLFLCSV